MDVISTPTLAMDITGTPSRSSCGFTHVANSTSNLQQPDMELQILDQVARLTIEEPPQLTPHQTPVVRKRKPSFVTPPGQNIFDTLENIMNVPPHVAASNNRSTRNSNYNRSQRKKPRCPFPGPMLPGTPEMEAAPSHKRYHHRPIYSPVLRTSNVNLDFMATLQHTQQDRDENHVTTAVATACGSSTERLPRTFFPALLDNCETAPRSSRRKLKMRRCDDEILLLDSNAL